MNRIALFPPSIFVACLVFAAAAQAQLIIAHRGASLDAPENTLAAFRLAWERGADGVEGDFRVTKDGKIVCLHDDTTKRTAAGKVNLRVAESSLEELRRLDVGAWKGVKFAGERIPTLEEVLATIPAGKLVFIEIKCGPEIVPLLKKELDANPRVGAEQIVIITFNEDVVRGCRRTLPRVKVNWLTGYKRGNRVGSWQPSADSVMATLRRIGATGLGTKAEPAVVGRGFVSRLREGGFEFHCWTINEAAIARQFRDLDVDSITTDRPGVIREALRVGEPGVEVERDVGGFAAAVGHAEHARRGTGAGAGAIRSAKNGFSGVPAIGVGTLPEQRGAALEGLATAGPGQAIERTQAVGPFQIPAPTTR